MNKQNQRLDTNRKTAVIYARASIQGCEKCTGERTQGALKKQQEQCEDYTKTILGAEVKASFTDANDGSKSMTGRPGFQNLLSYLFDDQHADYLVVADHDRLTRNYAEYILLMLAMDSLGTELVVVNASELDHSIVSHRLRR